MGEVCRYWIFNSMHKKLKLQSQHSTPAIYIYGKEFRNCENKKLQEQCPQLTLWVSIIIVFQYWYIDWTLSDWLTLFLSKFYIKLLLSPIWNATQQYKMLYNVCLVFFSLLLSLCVSILYTFSYISIEWHQTLVAHAIYY